MSLVLPTRSVGVATNAKQRAQLAALDRKAGSAQEVVADGAPYVCEAIKVLALSDDPAATANDVKRRLSAGLDVVEAEIHVEFVSKGVDKATALRRVLGDEMLRTATVAIGDGHNDAAMLRAAHVGVATANATEAAKTAAAAVSPWTNQGSCVARELDALLALPRRSRLQRWRDAYAEERRKYAAAHPGAANKWLHALLSPIEWVAFLAVLRRCCGSVVVWALQVCVCLGTAAARPPSTLWLAPPQLAMAADLYPVSPFYAAATWVAMIALQVGVGHGLLDRTAPSAAAELCAPERPPERVHHVHSRSRRRRRRYAQPLVVHAHARRLVVLVVDLAASRLAPLRPLAPLPGLAQSAISEALSLTKSLHFSTLSQPKTAHFLPWPLKKPLAVAVE